MCKRRRTANSSPGARLSRWHFPLLFRSLLAHAAWRLLALPVLAACSYPTVCSCWSPWFGTRQAFADCGFVACKGPRISPKQLLEEHGALAVCPESTREQSAVSLGKAFSLSAVSKEDGSLTQAVSCFQAENRKKGPGLGAPGKPSKRQSNETYRDAVRRVMFARYKELE